MSNADSPRDPHAPGLSRRGFVAGASAAGVVLLNGLLAAGALAADDAAKDKAAPDDKHEKVGVLAKKVKPGPKRPTCVAVYTDATGFRAVTSDDNGKLESYSIPDPIEIKNKFAAEHQGKASFVALAKTVELAVTAGFDGKVVVRNPFVNGNPIATIDTHVPPDDDPEVWVAVLSANGSRVLLGTNDGRIQLWHTQPPKKAWSFSFSTAPVAGLAFMTSPTGTIHFLSTHAGVINQWSLPDGPLQQRRCARPEPWQKSAFAPTVEHGNAPPDRR